MTEIPQEQSSGKPEDAYDLEGVTTPNHNYVPTEVVKAVRAFKAHRDVHIIVDTCADFAPKVVERLGVEVIGFPYIMDGVEHTDDIWKSISYEDYYAKLRAGSHVTTAAVSPGFYYEVFERAAKQGTPTIYLGFTGGLSSSIHAAEQARDMIADDYPGFELYVIDNLCPSACAELLAVEAVRLAGNGATASELYRWASEARYYLQGYFTLDNLDALAAGGRIPPAAAQLGGKLDIKPELSFDLNGSLTLKGICRGRKKALRALVSEFQENWCRDASLPIAIMHADAAKDADWLEDHLRREKGCEGLLIIRSVISPVLGAHVGPGMVAVGFWGGDRREKLSLTDRIAARVRSKG